MLIITFDIPKAIMWGIVMCIIFQYIMPKEKRLKGKNVAKFLLTLIVYAFIADKIEEPFRFIYCVVVGVFLIKNFYKSTISSSIIIFTIYIFLENFTAFICLHIIVKMLGIGYKDFRVSLLLNSICFSLNALSSVIIIYLFRLVKKKFFSRMKIIILQQKIQRLWHDKVTFIIYFTYGATLIIMGFILKVGKQFLDKKNMLLFISSTLILPILGILIFFLQRSYIANKMKLEHQQREYEQLKLYTGIIEGLSKDLRKYRHDFNNILFALRGFIDKEDMDGIKKYFYNEILREQKLINSSNAMYLHLQNISDLALKGVLTTKINRAMNLGLEVEISIMEEIDDIPVEAIDLCKMTGILLDNAIEAASETYERILSIVLMREYEKTSLIIGNSIKEKPDVEKIFMEGYSTKGKNRGLGLKILKELIDKKYRNIKLATSVDENFFIQEMVITNMKSKEKVLAL